MDLSEVNGYFNSKPGKKIAMKVIRGTDLMDKEITLATEI